MRVNLAKALRIKEGATKPVWADEDWLQMYSGKKEEASEATEAVPPKPVNEATKRQAEDAIEMAGVSVPSGLTLEFIRNFLFIF